MFGLETSGLNPDVSLLYGINGLAHGVPGWVGRTVAVLGEYGLLLGILALAGACWWTERRRAESLDSAAASLAAVLWAPLAAALAVLVNMPIRDFVRRPRPFVDHDGIDVLKHGEHGFSFVSDHATLAMAVAAGLFVVSRKYGLMALGMAFAEGFCRVFVGVQYPTDVIGGFALGTAVALLLSPLATAVLTPLVKAVGRAGGTGWLVRPRRRTGPRGGRSLRLQEGPGRADVTDPTDPREPAEAEGPGTPHDPRNPREPDLAA